MAIISLEKLLEPPTKTVTIDGLGDVKVRKIGAGEYARSVELVADGMGVERAFVDSAAFVVAHALVEPAVEGSQWEELRDKIPVDVLSKLHSEILEYSGLGAPDATEAQEVERRAERFPAAGDGSSGSDGGEAVESSADGEAVAGAAAPAG